MALAKAVPEIYGRDTSGTTSGLFVPSLHRMFIAIIASAVLLLLTSASLLMYRTGKSPAETVGAAEGLATIGAKR